ncbi:MAG: UbiA family prenyltransferase [Fibrobacterota bacterium]
MKFILDLIFITRPVLFIPVIGFALFGFRAAEAANGFLNPLSWEVLYKIFLFCLSVAAVYVLNQLVDYRVDRENGGFPLLLKSRISPVAAFLWMSILALASLALPLFHGLYDLFFLSAASLILGLVYCVRPFYFMGRPVLDFLSNGLGYGGIAFFAGYMSSFRGHFDTAAVLASLPYIFFMCAGSVSSTIPDIPGDKMNSKITTAVYMGSFRAHILGFLLLGCAFFLALWQGDAVAQIISLGVMPFYIAYILRQTRFLIELVYKGGGAVSMLVIGLVYPLFIIVAGIIAAATVLYFRTVYHVSYPSLVPRDE